MLETILAAAGNDVVTILGFAVLAVVLYRQNERLLSALIDELDDVKSELGDVRAEMVALSHQVNSSAVPPRRGGAGVLSDR